MGNLSLTHSLKIYPNQTAPYCVQYKVNAIRVASGLDRITHHAIVVGIPEQTGAVVCCRAVEVDD